MSTGSSRNWAGYIVGQTGTRVVCVQASWTEPKLTCPAKGERDVAIWVGIDGTATTTKARPLLQVGTWGSCRNGVERHYGWHEVYPTQPSIPFGPTIHAGDRMAAAVVFRKRSFTLTLVDLTTGRRMELVEQAPKAARLTAEWIVEAPSGGCPSSCHQLALPKFTPVRFSDARATIGSHVAGVDGPWRRQRTTMRSTRGILVSVGPLFSSGEGFTVSHP